MISCRSLSTSLRHVARKWRTVAYSTHGVVVEERGEDGDAFDDGGAELRFDAHPVLMEPPNNRFELLAALFVSVCEGAACRALDGVGVI